MKQTIKISLKFVLVMTVLLGVLYPLTMTGIGQLVFHDKVNGQLITKDDKVVGSKLIGQTFEGDTYLHGRPQEVSQLSPVSKEQEELVTQRVKQTQELEGTTDKVPSDLVLASGSGLDPEISVESAKYQVPRIAEKRHVTEKIVNDIINEHTTGVDNFMLSNKRVNVLEVNLALDDL
ncbi:potassium-transporting ATPase subunit C [Vagococcus sp. DIV0080]|uniref:Potassium-transporting ATPase KdpC subunit n=1 Tax=Candidatus Vagococcus giribetii TaxID=2230876 RepID=A0ABS3HSI1_9ENTE|nr:potassium-transporting ATPase subunit C [Vagococcus sp. DIV0080]MBO0476725.1 potassium-transporting ATPase subunit C [Vagococcus sp. DIV0080]